ncbi:MAG: guanylate kinase [Gemmatimonadales bacterium]|nr:guanylate kinase [Gemmatimonadales bacterium]
MPGTARELGVAPFLLVLSSPSGGGKSTIARHLLDAREDVTYSVSATTRGKRPGEEEGRHYHFLSRSEFERRVAADEFAEWAEYEGNLYGTLRSEVERGLGSGRHVVLDIEVAGARQVRKRFPDSVQVFVLPPSASELIHRLTGRNTEPKDAIARRLAIASQELMAAAEYDYVVVNDDVVEAVAQVAAILDVEARRVRRIANLNVVIDNLRKDLTGLSERLGGSDAPA